MRIPLISGLALTLLLTACGGSEHGHETIHDGTQATTDNGVLTISFTSVPSPLAQGQNVITATVKEASGTPLTGANVHPELYLPGNEPGPDEPVTTEKGEGVYEISNVVVPAAGEYHLTFHVTKTTAEIHDHATFRVVVK